MTTTHWTPEVGPKISKAWHAIRDCLDLNGAVDHQTLVSVAVATGVVEKTATNLLGDLRNHGYISRRRGVYTLRSHGAEATAADLMEPAHHVLVETTTFEDQPQTRHTCTVCGAESVGHAPPLPCPGRSNVRPADPAREARYALALHAFHYQGVIHWDESAEAEREVFRSEARAVMAVADEERAADRAEIERLRGEVAGMTGMRNAARRARDEADARLDALVADLRGLAARIWLAGPPDGGTDVPSLLRGVEAVLDKHAGEQAQGGEGRG